MMNYSPEFFILGKYIGATSSINASMSVMMNSVVVGPLERRARGERVIKFRLRRTQRSTHTCSSSHSHKMK